MRCDARGTGLRWPQRNPARRGIGLGGKTAPVASRRRIVGLTLIELMVALAVFAVLGTLTYRGTGQLLDGRTAIERELERWREISRALHIIETELLQVVAPATARTPAPAGADNAGAAPPLRWHGTGGRHELELLGMAGGGLVERIIFRHVEGRIDWIRHADALPAATAETDVLIDQVTGLRVRFLASGRWGDAWPRPNAVAALPQAVEIHLDLPDQGTITRLYALR